MRMAALREDASVKVYALTDGGGGPLGDAVEIYVTRDEAEAALADVLRDEPSWDCELAIVEVELRAGA